MKECELCHKIVNETQPELVPSHGYMKMNICDTCEVFIIQQILNKHK